MLRAAVVMVCMAACASDEEPRCGDGMIDLLHESCDDGNTEAGDGCSSTCRTESAVTVHWTIQDPAGTPQACPAGADTVDVALVTQRFTDTAMPFPCVDGQHHLEWLEIPRSAAIGVELTLTSSTTHDVFAKKMTFIGSTDDVTVVLTTDGNPLPK